MKPVQKIIISKVRELLEKQKLSNAISHNSTKGDLGESFLKDFIIDIIPREYELTSGFVTSNNQNELSPQIDLIVTDRSKTPKFILNENNSIVPFESVLLTFEIKTTITSQVINQLNKQREFINNCGKPNFYRNNFLKDIETIENKINIKTFSNKSLFDKPLNWLVGFKSQLSKEKIRKQIIEKVEGTAAVWIINEFCLYVENGKIKEVSSEESTLFSVEKILTMLFIMQQQRFNYYINWTKYLKE